MTFRMTMRAAARRAWRPKPVVPADAQRAPAWIPPDHRKTIITIDYDSGAPVMHVFELRRTKRIDTFLVTIDGKPWKRAGVSRVLDAVRRSMPRIASARHMR